MVILSNTLIYMSSTINPTSSTAESIEITDLTLRYPGVPVFEDSSLCIPARGLVQIVGPNGGGKTSLARLLMGLIKAQKGNIRILGRNPNEMKSRIGYVPQHSMYDPQFPSLVFETVLTGRLKKHFGPYNAADKKAVWETLELLDIRNIAKQSFADLSGGQRQRVLLARALVSLPELLILDEPTANIDRVSAARLEELIRQLKSRFGILLITHDFDFLADSVDHVLCINRSMHLHNRRDLTHDDMQRLFSGHFHDMGMHAGCHDHSTGEHND
ncbi:ABC transporter ATP-binding protein [Spirochaeta dissipatitropha]